MGVFSNIYKVFLEFIYIIHTIHKWSQTAIYKVFGKFCASLFCISMVNCACTKKKEVYFHGKDHFT